MPPHTFYCASVWTRFALCQERLTIALPILSGKERWKRGRHENKLRAWGDRSPRGPTPTSSCSGGRGTRAMEAAAADWRVRTCGRSLREGVGSAAAPPAAPGCGPPRRRPVPGPGLVDPPHFGAWKASGVVILRLGKRCCFSYPVRLWGPSSTGRPQSGWCWWEWRWVSLGSGEYRPLRIECSPSSARPSEK